MTLYYEYTVLMIGRLMNVKQLVEWEWAGEAKVLTENLPQGCFAHHRFHVI